MKEVIIFLFIVFAFKIVDFNKSSKHTYSYKKVKYDMDRYSSRY